MGFLFYSYKKLLKIVYQSLRKVRLARLLYSHIKKNQFFKIWILNILKKIVNFNNIFMPILRKFEYLEIIYLDQYNIAGTLNFNPKPEFGDPKAYPNFQKELELFKNHLFKLVAEEKSKTFYKFGDGDYYFLKKQEYGSAAPGKRALSKSYEEINHQEFVDGVLVNDYILVEIDYNNRRRFNEIYPKRQIDYPAEYCYGLVANKWLFKTFKGKIGLIGAKEKIELIKNLMKYEEYKNYLGIDKFNDYISIPQKFACDNVNSVEEMVSKQLLDSKSNIFLLGIGHVKSALLHRLKKYKNAIYLDVGSGIDAIAGVINVKRPYMGNWINFRLKKYNYSNIDDLMYEKAGKHVVLN